MKKICIEPNCNNIISKWSTGRCISCANKIKFLNKKSLEKLIQSRKKYFLNNPSVKQSLSIKFSGSNNPFFGKEHTKETKKKQSEVKKGNHKIHKLNCNCCSCCAKRGEYKGHNNPNFGNHKLKLTEIERLERINKNTLWHLIRTLNEYKMWRKQVFERDNYTCQSCGKKSKGNIEAHHTKEFKLIIQEFLHTYSQFSPIEDKETLIRLAITYAPFWDVNNGETLCKDCHDKVRHNKLIYKKNKTINTVTLEQTE